MANNDVFTINLDKERTLKFRRKELKLLEKSLGKKITKIDFNDIGIDDISKMIHLALQHEDESLTLEQVEALMDNSEMYFGEMNEAVMKAFAVSMGGPKALERFEEITDIQEAKN
ncbi:MAG: hypothetical protein WA125_17065 [Desulfosporosinus sp.]